MNSYRLGFFYIALVVVVFICFGSLSILAQKDSTSAPTEKPCVGLHCAFVRIDDVSGKELNYITASGRAGTYILSCLDFASSPCQLPIKGQEYEYSEMPVTDQSDDRYAFLIGPHVNHEQYTLEVIVPELSLSEVRSLMGECLSSVRFADEADCGKWITRKLKIQRAACLDPEAVVACKSFQELVRANDPYIMDDLANQDHVYACFLPGKDEFFEVIFSEPPYMAFMKPDEDQVKEGVPSDALTAPGISQFAYYKNGIGDEKRSLTDYGNWIYFPLGSKTDYATLRKNATSKHAKFTGKTIEIEGDRWTLTETYKNQANTETRHTVTIQLATGRFKEAFVLTGTGMDLGENSGRCLIVPSDYFSASAVTSTQGPH